MPVIVKTVKIETVLPICTPSEDMDIVVAVAIENPAGIGDLVVTLYDSEGTTLDSYGTGLGLPESWGVLGPIPVEYPLTIPSGTTGIIQIGLATNNVLDSYDGLFIGSISLAP